MNTTQHRFDINRDYVRLLQAMRRFVKEEFNVGVRLAEEDTPLILLEHAERSRNAVLREMGKELREFIAPEKATVPVRQFYRGAAVMPREAVKPAPASHKTAPRLYRGQPVRG